MPDRGHLWVCSLSALVSPWALRAVNRCAQSYVSQSAELIPCKNFTQKWLHAAYAPSFFSLELLTPKSIYEIIFMCKMWLLYKVSCMGIPSLWRLTDFAVVWQRSTFSQLSTLEEAPDLVCCLPDRVKKFAWALHYFDKMRETCFSATLMSN